MNKKKQFGMGMDIYERTERASWPKEIKIFSVFICDKCGNTIKEGDLAKEYAQDGPHCVKGLEGLYVCWGGKYVKKTFIIPSPYCWKLL